MAAVNEGWWHYSHKYHGFRARAQLVNNLMNGDPLYIHWFPFWFLFVLSSFCEMSSGSWSTQTLAVLFTQVHIKGTDVKVGLNCCRPKQTSVWTIWFWWTATTWPGAWPFDLVSHNTPLVQPYVPGDGLSYWIENGCWFRNSLISLLWCDVNSLLFKSRPVSSWIWAKNMMNSVSAGKKVLFSSGHICWKNVM